MESGWLHRCRSLLHFHVRYGWCAEYDVSEKWRVRQTWKLDGFPIMALFIAAPLPFLSAARGCVWWRLLDGVLHCGTLLRCAGRTPESWNLESECCFGNQRLIIRFIDQRWCYFPIHQHNGIIRSTWDGKNAWLLAEIMSSMDSHASKIILRVKRNAICWFNSMRGEQQWEDDLINGLSGRQTYFNRGWVICLIAEKTRFPQIPDGRRWVEA